MPSGLGPGTARFWANLTLPCQVLNLWYPSTFTCIPANRTPARHAYPLTPLSAHRHQSHVNMPMRTAGDFSHPVRHRWRHAESGNRGRRKNVAIFRFHFPRAHHCPLDWHEFARSKQVQRRCKQQIFLFCVNAGRPPVAVQTSCSSIFTMIEDPICGAAGSCLAGARRALSTAFSAAANEMATGEIELRNYSGRLDTSGLSPKRYRRCHLPRFASSKL